MTSDFISFSGFGLRHSFVIGRSGFVIFFSHPITLRFPVNETLVVLRIAKSDVVPTGARPLRHGVGFACRFVGITNPLFRFRQRRFAGSRWFEISKLRWNHRQLRFVQCPMMAVFPHNWEWFTPVTLTRE